MGDGVRAARAGGGTTRGRGRRADDAQQWGEDERRCGTACRRLAAVGRRCAVAGYARGEGAWAAPLGAPGQCPDRCSATLIGASSHWSGSLEIGVEVWSLTKRVLIHTY
uniref:Uncharacterized protein n=1 Tax=Oryza sativa subsp. japonica TaxID=39947 RepID=Q7EY64_ORYSJ|nr:hypothetical protein [Oryza sativa Japonica Group]BAD01461.1 hypothetical protein [Oryza sativa Japonica Group]